MSKPTATLSERYVADVLRAVPPDQRPEVAGRLRDAIEASVDARIHDGEPRSEAEREVLTALGDPLRVASGYSGRPLHLIGPGVFPDFVRLLRLLLTIVVPIVAVVVGTTTVLAGSDPWQALLAAAGTALNVGVQVAFWVTLEFAIIERTGRAPDVSTWDLDDLPDLPAHRIGLGETVVSIVAQALLAWVLVWRPSYQPTLDPGGPSIPILAPELSSFWIPYLVCVLLAIIALEIDTYRIGRWTVMLAGVNTLLSVAFIAPLIWLIQNAQVLNPEFVTAVSMEITAPLVQNVPTLIAGIIVVVTLIDVVSSWWKALRNR
ncbi:MAG: hypothetical protein ACKOW5_14300 [Actinomycetales bacterium]